MLFCYENSAQETPEYRGIFAELNPRDIQKSAILKAVVWLIKRKEAYTRVHFCPHNSMQIMQTGITVMRAFLE